LANKKNSSKIAYLDFRLSPSLKMALDKYCDEHIEKTTEAINNAIKCTTGFGGTPLKKTIQQFEPDTGKTIRLNVRTHPLLKISLDEYCLKNGMNLTDAVTNAIKNYIGFSENLK
jgi:hypothetical protein